MEFKVGVKIVCERCEFLVCPQKLLNDRQYIFHMINNDLRLMQAQALRRMGAISIAGPAHARARSHFKVNFCIPAISARGCVTR